MALATVTGTIGGPPAIDIPGGGCCLQPQSTNAGRHKTVSKDNRTRCSPILFSLSKKRRKARSWHLSVLARDLYLRSTGTSGVARKPPPYFSEIQTGRPASLWRHPGNGAAPIGRERHQY